MNKQLIILALIVRLIFTLNIYGQTSNPGRISGSVVDAETQTALPGTNVILVGGNRGTATDAGGKFILNNIPVGSYSLKIMYLGYETRLISDVIVKPNRTTTVRVMLKQGYLQGEEITVTAGYFPKKTEEPSSSITFSREEIRRAPGSGGDVSRILFSLPGIAKINDQSNNLIVRGGNPIENTFFVDNIEIPNINHFPAQGSSGGPIGLLNIDFIKDVSFKSGGFSAKFGDRLSSVMDISFREGSRISNEWQFDLDFTGFGFVSEGPLGKGKGSWLFAARRSYLDMLVKVLDVGSTIAPQYGDYQGKIVWDLNAENQLTLLGIFGDDHNAPGKKTALSNKMSHYGRQDIHERTAGLNWRRLWGGHGFSNTSLSWTNTIFDEAFRETSTDIFAFKNLAAEHRMKLRNVNHFRIHPQVSLDFGLETRLVKAAFDNFYGATTNQSGEQVPALILDKKITTAKSGAFITTSIKPAASFTVTAGLRYDHFAYNDRISFSPRFSINWALGPLTALNFTAGRYTQTLPLLLLSQQETFRNLRNPQADHFIVGFQHLVTSDTRLTIESYYKSYKCLPLSPVQPEIFPLDAGYLTNVELLTDKGKAAAYGLEFTLQKKLAKKVYGLVSGSWFRSRYRDSNHVWRDRKFDNRFTFSAEGGYKLNAKWEFSGRWIFAGGAPYTPLDIDASALNHRSILDMSQYHSKRYPDYHALNIRFDRRIALGRSNLVFYLSIWNTYNRKNVAEYFWNDIEKKVDTLNQWLILPIFGFELEL